MTNRLNNILKRNIPRIDQDDLKLSYKNTGEARQFAPEYAQAAYITLLKQECAIGNYFNVKGLSIKFVTAQ